MYQLHKSTKTLQRLASVRLRIDLCRVKDFQNTRETTWLGKHVAASESTLPEIVEKPILFCNFYPRLIFAFSTGAPKGLASGSKEKMDFSSPDFETTKTVYWEATCEKRHKPIVDGSQRESLT